MMTGYPPRYNLDEVEVLDVIRKEDPPRVEPDSQWSKPLQDLLAQMLTKEPSERPTASQLMKHEFFSKYEFDTINPLDIF